VLFLGLVRNFSSSDRFCCVFVVEPFKAVYNYTPSKLPSSVAMHTEPRLTQEVNGNTEAITESVSSLSPAAADVGTNGNGALDTYLKAADVGINGNGALDTNLWSADVETNGNGALDTTLKSVDVGTNGNGALDTSLELGGCSYEPLPDGIRKGIETMVVYSSHADCRASGAGPWHFPQSSCIRRSCSLDGVALASGCHGDSDVIRQSGASVGSSDDDAHSQGLKVSSLLCSVYSVFEAAYI